MRFRLRLMTLLVVIAPGGPLAAQIGRVTLWGGYEGVTGSDDWTTLGAQLTGTSRRGDALWVAGERLGRFGAHDVTTRVGVVLHPMANWWVSAEGATAAQPAFAPKNSWEFDVTARLTAHASTGMRYRRQNYVVGAVDVGIPHFTAYLGRVGLELRVFVSRNPSARTDVALLTRATAPLTSHLTVWLGVGAGRESYLVGASPTQQVRSLKTLTALSGARYQIGRRTLVRIDVTVVRSTPVLSRRGGTVGVTQQF